MKYLWVSSVFMTGLILGGGNAIAASENILSGTGQQNLPESRLLLADASLDLDITMEVVDEDVQSSKDITNIIELPLRSRYREMHQHQEQLGNGPAYSNGPGGEQGQGPNPLEGNQEPQQQINRPDNTGRTDSVSPGRTDSASRPDSVSPGRTDSIAGRPDSVSPGEMDNRDNATRGPADSGAKDAGQVMQNRDSNTKGR